MSDSLIILEKLVLLFCFIFVGFFCFRKGWLTKQGTSEISNLIVNVFNPLLMISTALSGSGSIPKNLMAQNLILMALFYGLMILLGPVVAKLLRVQGNDRKLVTIMLVFANTAFMGIPLVESLYGSRKRSTSRSMRWDSTFSSIPMPFRYSRECLGTNPHSGSRISLTRESSVSCWQ